MRELVSRRSAIRVAAVIRKVAWFVLRPRTVGSQIVVLNERGEVLLVRHSYDRDWLRLPGGGAKRSETFAECAARELREETSLEVADPEKLELLGVYTGREGNQAAFIAAFVAPPGSWAGSPTPTKSPEIDSTEFHRVDALPADTSPATRSRVSEAVSGRRGISGRW